MTSYTAYMIDFNQLFIDVPNELMFGQFQVLFSDASGPQASTYLTVNFKNGDTPITIGLSVINAVKQYASQNGYSPLVAIYNLSTLSQLL